MKKEYQDLSDEELMLEARKDDSVFTEIIFRYESKLMNYFKKMGVLNHNDDLVQETFLKLYHYRNTYTDSAKLSTFIYMIARQRLTDYWRREASRKKVIAVIQNDKEEDKTINIEPINTRGERASQALQSLPEAMRSVVVMSVYDKLKYSEIAKILEIPLGTVKSRMSKAFKEIKARMGESIGSK